MLALIVKLTCTGLAVIVGILALCVLVTTGVETLVHML